MTIYVETDTTSQIASSSWIKKIHITSPKYNLVYDLSIGTDKNQYIEKLGKKYVGGTYDLDMNPLSYNVSIYESSNGASLHTFHEITIMISPAGKSESITWELGDAD